MSRKVLGLVLVCGLVIAGSMTITPQGVFADGDSPALTVSGYVRNDYGEGVVGATVSIKIVSQPAGTIVGPARSTRSDEAGTFVVRFALTTRQAEALKEQTTQLVVVAGKPSYADAQTIIPVAALARADSHYFSELDLVLHHKPTIAVFLSATILIGVYVLITLERLHRTVAALLGAAAILIITHVFGSFNQNFIILPFERAVTYIDFNVIFLLMAMMVLVTITARTGVFQWLAVVAYRRAGGSIWRLAVLLTLATAGLSALLDNVTTMLLIVPITLEIALILRLNALALLLPEVFASNIGGAATLIGDPPNLLIASFAGLSFGSFLVYMAPVAIIVIVSLFVLMRRLYPGQYPQTPLDETQALLHRLEKEFVIKDGHTLRRALITFGGVIFFFLLSSLFKMEASVPALMGMVVLLVWTQANIVQELESVEWPSLIFFMALFIVIGAADETGVIQVLSDAVEALTHGSLVVAIILIIWVSALASMLVDNIPITATLLPVVAHLTQVIPGATNNILYWALALGTCFGGNGTIVGASANIITVGLAERAGFAISFGQFTRKGVPVMIMSLVIATMWVLFIAWIT